MSGYWDGAGGGGGTTTTTSSYWGTKPKAKPKAKPGGTIATITGPTTVKGKADAKADLIRQRDQLVAARPHMDRETQKQIDLTLGQINQGLGEPKKKDNLPGYLSGGSYGTLLDKAQKPLTTATGWLMHQAGRLQQGVMSAVGEAGRESARGAAMKVPGVPRWLSNAALGQALIPIPGLGAILGGPVVSTLTSSPSHVSPRAIVRAAGEGVTYKRQDTPVSAIADMAKIDAAQGENDTTAVAWDAVNRSQVRVPTPFGRVRVPTPGAALVTNIVGSIVTDPITYATFGAESLTREGFKLMEDLGMSDATIQSLRLRGWEKGLSEVDKAAIIAKAGGEERPVISALKNNARGGVGLRIPFASPTGRTVLPFRPVTTPIREAIEATVGTTRVGQAIGEASGAIKQAGRHLFMPDAELYKNPDLGGRVRRQIYEAKNVAESQSRTATEAAGIQMLHGTGSETLTESAARRLLPDIGGGRPEHLATTEELEGVVGDALDLYGYRDNLDDRLRDVFDNIDAVRRQVDDELKRRGKVPDPKTMDDAIAKLILERTKRGEKLAADVEMWRTRAEAAAYQNPPGKPGPGQGGEPWTAGPRPQPQPAPQPQPLTPTLAPTPSVLPTPPAPPPAPVIPAPVAEAVTPPPIKPPAGVLPPGGPQPAEVLTLKGERSVPNDLIERYTQANPGHGVVEGGKFPVKNTTNIKIRSVELPALKAEAQRMADRGHAGARAWLESLAPAEEAPSLLGGVSVTQARDSAKELIRRLADAGIEPATVAELQRRLLNMPDDAAALTAFYDELRTRYPDQLRGVGPGAKAAKPKRPLQREVDEAEKAWGRAHAEFGENNMETQRRRMAWQELKTRREEMAPKPKLPGAKAAGREPHRLGVDIKDIGPDAAGTPQTEVYGPSGSTGKGTKKIGQVRGSGDRWYAEGDLTKIGGRGFFESRDAAISDLMTRYRGSLSSAEQAAWDSAIASRSNTRVVGELREQGLLPGAKAKAPESPLDRLTRAMTPGAKRTVGPATDPGFEKATDWAAKTVYDHGLDRGEAITDAALRDLVEKHPYPWQREALQQELQHSLTQEQIDYLVGLPTGPLANLPMYEGGPKWQQAVMHAEEMSVLNEAVTRAGKETPAEAKRLKELVDTYNGWQSKLPDSASKRMLSRIMDDATQGAREAPLRPTLESSVLPKDRATELADLIAKGNEEHQFGHGPSGMTRAELGKYKAEFAKLEKAATGEERKRLKFLFDDAHTRARSEWQKANPRPVLPTTPEPAGRPKNIDEAIETGNFGEYVEGENPMYTILRENQRRLDALGPAPPVPKGEDWSNLRSISESVAKNEADRAAGRTVSDYAKQSDPYWKRYYGKATAAQKAFMDKMLDASRRYEAEGAGKGAPVRPGPTMAEQTGVGPPEPILGTKTRATPEPPATKLTKPKLPEGVTLESGLGHPGKRVKFEGNDIGRIEGSTKYGFRAYAFTEPTEEARAAALAGPSQRGAGSVAEFLDPANSPEIGTFASREEAAQAVLDHRPPVGTGTLSGGPALADRIAQMEFKATPGAQGEFDQAMADWKAMRDGAAPAERIAMDKWINDARARAREATTPVGEAMPPIEEIAKPKRKPAPTSAEQVRQPDGALQHPDKSVGPIEPTHSQPLPPTETIEDVEKATVETQLPNPPKAPPPRALRWDDRYGAYVVADDTGKSVGMVKPTSDGERFVARTKGQELPQRYTSPEAAAEAIHEANKPTTVLAPEPSGQGVLPQGPAGAPGAEPPPGGAPPGSRPKAKAGGGAAGAPPPSGGGPTRPRGWEGPGQGPWERGQRAAQTRIWATMHMNNAQRALETNARLIDELLERRARGVLEIEDYRPRVLTPWGKKFARKYPTMAEKYGITPDATDRFLAPRHVKPESTLRDINDEIRQYAIDNGMKEGNFFEPNPVVGQLIRTQSAYTSIYAQDMVQKWATIKDAKGQPIFKVLDELPDVNEATPELIKRLRGEKEIPEGWRTDTLPMGENGEHIVVAAPEEVIETIKPLLKVSDPNQVAQFYDASLAYWKAMATVPIVPLPTGVGFHVRNASTNVMMNWISNVGIRSGDYTAMFKLQWKMFRSRQAFGDLRYLNETERALVERMYDEGTFRPQFMGQVEEQAPTVMRRNVVSSGAATSAEKKVRLRRGLSLTPIRREGGKWIPNIDTWWVKSGAELGGAIETNARMAHYLAAERATGDAARAGASMRKWLFDYGDLAPFEKNVMRRVMPFYTFTRKVIPRVAEGVLANPRKLRQFEIVRESLGTQLAPVQGEEERSHLKPHYLDQYPGLIPITPQAWPKWAQTATGWITGNPELGYLQMDTPFDVPFQQMDAWAGIASDAVEGVPGLRRLPDSKTGWSDFYQTQVSMLGGPIAGAVKAGAEVQGGRDFFSGAPIRHEPVPAPFPLNLLGRGGLPFTRERNVNGDRKETISAGERQLIYALLPQIQKWESAFPYDPKNKEKVKRRRLSAFTGLGQYPIGPVTESNEAYYRQALIDQLWADYRARTGNPKPEFDRKTGEYVPPDDGLTGASSSGGSGYWSNP